MAIINPSPRHAFLLTSGGFDSTALICYYALRGYIIHPFKMRYDSKQIEAEETALKKVLGWFSTSQIYPLTTIDVPLVNTSELASAASDVPSGSYSEVDSKSLMVPGRNMAFISILANVAEAFALNNPDAIVVLGIGVHGSDWSCYPDCRPEFIMSMAQVISASTESRVRLDAPFLHKSKGGTLDSVTRGGEFVLPAYMKYALENSYSCYRGGETHCGTCPTCIERHEAFLMAFDHDPTIYEKTPKLPPKKLYGVDSGQVSVNSVPEYPASVTFRK